MPVPENDNSASRVFSMVPSAMTATPPGASSIKPTLVSTPITRHVPDPVRHGAERHGVCVREHHELLLRIVPVGVSVRRARGFHQQGDGAELVEREEASAWRSRLHGQRRFEFEEILQVIRREADCRIKTQQLGQVRGRLQQRRRRQFVQRDGGAHGAQIVKELLPQGMVQLAEHEIIRLVDSDLPSALVEVHGVQIGYRRGAARS